MKVTKVFHAGTKKQHSAEPQPIGKRTPANFCGDCGNWYKPQPFRSSKH